MRVTDKPTRSRAAAKPTLDALVKARALDVDAALAAVKALEAEGRPLAAAYAGGTGTTERYTLEQHTRMVLRQFERYLPDAALPPGVSRAFLRKLLLVHDLGKPDASSHLQREHHARTLELIDAIRPAYWASKKERQLAAALIDGDPFGAYLNPRRQGTLEGAAAELGQMAQRSGLPLPDFLRLCTAFYQSDAASYTADAGGQPSLEALFAQPDGTGFKYDAARHRLAFGPGFEERFRALEHTLAEDAAIPAHLDALEHAATTRKRSARGGKAKTTSVRRGAKLAALLAQIPDGAVLQTLRTQLGRGTSPFRDLPLQHALQGDLANTALSALEDQRAKLLECLAGQGDQPYKPGEAKTILEGMVRLQREGLCKRSGQVFHGTSSPAIEGIARRGAIVSAARLARSGGARRTGEGALMTPSAMSEKPWVFLGYGHAGLGESLGYATMGATSPLQNYTRFSDAELAQLVRDCEAACPEAPAMGALPTVSWFGFFPIVQQAGGAQVFTDRPHIEALLRSLRVEQNVRRALGPGDRPESYSVVFELDSRPLEFQLVRDDRSVTGYRSWEAVCPEAPLSLCERVIAPLHKLDEVKAALARHRDVSRIDFMPMESLLLALGQDTLESRRALLRLVERNLSTSLYATSIRQKIADLAHAHRTHQGAKPVAAFNPLDPFGFWAAWGKR